jgi:hypothetical protein
MHTYSTYCYCCAPQRDLTRTGTLHTIRLVVVDSTATGRCGEGLVEGDTGMMGKTLVRKF